jgi:hypothetical protein
MNKLSMSLLSALSLFTLTSDAFSAPVRATPALCSAPRIISKNNLQDFNHKTAKFGSEERIYFGRMSGLGSGPVLPLERNPGRDKIFGTQDDSERVVPEMVLTVYEDIAVVVSSDKNPKEKLLKPGPDNVLFTADDSQINIPNAESFAKNGDLIAWIDWQTGEIKACDQKITTGPGSCTEDTNHWAVPSTINNHRLSEFPRGEGLLYPSKQLINGQMIPMVIAVFSGSEDYFRVIMMDSGFSFPLTQLVDPNNNYHAFGIRGHILFSSESNLTGIGLFETNINYNSVGFLTKTQTPTNSIVELVDSRTNNGSIMPAYLSSDSNNNVVYNDHSRGITAQIPVQSRSFIFPRDIKDKVVVVDLLTPHPTLGFQLATAVSHCP